MDAEPTDTTTTAETTWVAAAPFRAHLSRLAETTETPWQVIALSSGVSLREADRLLHGRPGPGGRRRALRRISRATAVRLLAATDAEVLALRSTWIPAAATCKRLAELVARGVSPEALAAQLGCTATSVIALVEGAGVRGKPAPSVTLAFALGVRAACEAADRAAVRALSAAA
ncbi:MAG: hypothetical protein ACLGHZ_00350 [Actinomycetes bacterium]